MALDNVLKRDLPSYLCPSLFSFFPPASKCLRVEIALALSTHWIDLDL